MATNLIWKIGIHTTPNTSKPTIPNLGSHLTLTGYTEIGSVARGDDLDLNDESVDLPFMREFSMIKAPVTLAAQDHILKSAGATDWSFGVYDFSEALYALDSNTSISSNTMDFTMTTTKRTVMLEVNGYASFYFPQCIVEIGGAKGANAGDDAAMTTQVTIKPEGTASVPGGMQIDWFQAA